MRRYLLDRDVLSQLDQPEPQRHPNIRSWFSRVPDDALFISAITVMEAWRGFGMMRRRARAPAELAQLAAYETAFDRLVSAFDTRVLPVDAMVARHWGRLRGASDKHQWDAGVAATAIVHDLIVATRNGADFAGRGVRVVDPFRKNPAN